MSSVQRDTGTDSVSEQNILLDRRKKKQIVSSGADGQSTGYWHSLAKDERNCSYCEGDVDR